MKLLSGLVLSCLKHMLTMAAENELPNRDGITSRTVRRLSAAANSLEDIIFAGKWSKISDGLDDVLNFSSGSKPAAKAKLGFGFTVLASHAHGLRRAGRSVAQPA